MVSGSEPETKETIVTTLRETEEPALSAAAIAEETGYSKRTINNHVKDLVESNRIQDTTIGNAQAYYINNDSGELPPDHICNRCRRPVDELYDFTKVEFDRYFSEKNADPGTADFYILCRFCHTDFISFLFGDDGAMHDYPQVHSWDIPENQLEEVREDNTITTHPGLEFLEDKHLAIYEAIEAIEEEKGSASIRDINNHLSQNSDVEFSSLQMLEREVENVERRGLVYYKMGEDSYKTAK